MSLPTSAIRLAATLITVVLAAASCTDATGIRELDRVPSEIRFSAPEFTLNPGDVIHLEAEVYDQYGDRLDTPLPDGAIRWSTSDERIAEVTPSGRVTGIQPGQASLSAALGDLTLSGVSAGLFPGEGGGSSKRQANANVEVKSGAVELRIARGDNQEGFVNTVLEDSIVVRAVDGSGAGVPKARIKFTVLKGDGEVSSRVVAADDNGSAGVTWTLGPHPGQGRVEAILNENGFKGSALIFRSTADERTDDNSGGGEQADQVRVISAEPSEINFAALESTESVVGRAFDEKGNELEEVTFDFYSLNSHVATVDDQGLVSSAGNGTAKVVVAAGGLTDTVYVVVEQVPASLNVSPDSQTLNAINDTVVFVPTVRDANGHTVAEAEVEWSSSDSSVAIVKFDGRAISAAAGVALLTATVPCAGSACSANADVQVRQIAADVTVDSPSESLDIGATAQLVASASDSNGVSIEDPDFTWSSSDVSIVTVDQHGVATAREDGTASIQATSDDGASASDSAPVTVGSGGDGDSDGDTESGSSVAELPRVFIDTEYSAPSGDTLRVGPNDDLQSALNAANRGDVVLLSAGATYTGNFTLPAKAGSGWIVVTSDTELPAEGERMNPAYSGQLARIVSDNSDAALQAENGAAQYRIMGIEITAASGVETSYGLIKFGGPSTAKPHDLVLDRLYVHGQPNLQLRRCVLANSGALAIIDSYLSECHASGFDSQAIVGWDGPGPFKIVNNYLEGAGENVMFGGADPSNADMVPADIEIRRNHFNKPVAWESGGDWTVKNLLEFKLGKRILIEGNVLENNWKDAQAGFAIVLKSANQGGGEGEWSTTTDLTMRYNVIRNVASAVNVAGTGNGPIEEPLSRVHIHDNLFENIGAFDGSARTFQIISNHQDVVIESNSILSSAHTTIIADGSGAAGFVFRNNLANTTSYGVLGTGTAEGTPTLEHYMPGYIFTGNALVGRKSSKYPSGNYFPSSISEAPASAGADQSQVESLTAGVVD